MVNQCRTFGPIVALQTDTEEAKKAAVSYVKYLERESYTMIVRQTDRQTDMLSLCDCALMYWMSLSAPRGPQQAVL